MPPRESWALAALLATGIVAVRADPNDWINPAYAQAAARNPPVGTTKSIQSVLHAAVKSSRDGPWTIRNNTVFAPSGDKRDYFSWAPYHWPDCNWCNASHVNTTSASGPASTAPVQAGLPGDAKDDSTDEQTSDDTEPRRRSLDEHAQFFFERDGVIAPPEEQPLIEHKDAHDSSGGAVLLGTVEDPFIDPNASADWSSLPWWNETSTDQAVEDDRRAGHGVNAWGNFRRPMSKRDDGEEQHEMEKRAPAAPGPSKPPPAAVTASRAAKSGADRGPQVSATQKPSSTKGKPSCTPSSTYVAPTATYSVCKYVQKDGQVNPDVRTLNSSDYMGKVTQAGITNALSWVLTKDTDYSKTAASFIDMFFADNTTGMNPNLNYGQVVRGPPGNQFGSFMAVVDLRGITKIANAVQLLRQTNAPDWTLDRDRRMVAWAKGYINWLQTSPIGKKSGTAANNHGTFFFNQMAALQILIGDYVGAKASLTSFFNGAFKDQITATGEQPFEAIRTRPYHYRAFNLEALVVNAKLADQLGLNMWTARTKYNSTIQSAIDFTMRLDPKGEDAAEMVPHVLVAIAVYGDPKGTYQSWVKKTMPDYDTRIYHIYNQPGAFVASPVSAKQRSAQTSQPTPAPASSASSANGKRDLADERYDQHVIEMQMQPGAGAGMAALDTIRADSLNETLPAKDSQSSSGSPIERLDINPRAVSDWHSLRDFTWLAPPLRLARRLADQATSFWTGGSQLSKAGTGQKKQDGEGQTLASEYKDVLHMREDNAFRE